MLRPRARSTERRITDLFELAASITVSVSLALGAPPSVRLLARPAPRR